MNVLAFIAPETMRTIVLIVAGVGYLGYHVLGWWLGRREEKKVEVEGRGREEEEEAKAKVEGEEKKVEVEGRGREEEEEAKAKVEGEEKKVEEGEKVEVGEEKVGGESRWSEEGEEVYRRARAMKHQVIPDYRMDGLYLDLLGEAAEKGYAPAMAKLADYALRRGARVEAYYWLSLAKRHGMRSVTTLMQVIRRDWTLARFPDEFENVSPIFPAKAGSIGRALLCMDSGHDAANARLFLKDVGFLT